MSYEVPHKWTNLYHVSRSVFLKLEKVVGYPPCCTNINCLVLLSPNWLQLPYYALTGKLLHILRIITVDREGGPRTRYVLIRISILRNIINRFYSRLFPVKPWLQKKTENWSLLGSSTWFLYLYTLYLVSYASPMFMKTSTQCTGTCLVMPLQSSTQGTWLVRSLQCLWILVHSVPG